METSILDSYPKLIFIRINTNITIPARCNSRLLWRFFVIVNTFWSYHPKGIYLLRRGPIKFDILRGIYFQVSANMKLNIVDTPPFVIPGYV